MFSVRRLILFRYLLAIICTALAIVLTYVSHLHDASLFLIPFVAVLVSARYGGLGPGIVSSIGGSLAVAYYFVFPFNSLQVYWTSDILILFTFLFISLTTTWFIATHDAARKRAAVQAAQQAAVARLGQGALASHDLDSFLKEATRVVCKTLNVEYSEVLELLPDGQAFLLRAGYGWKPGYIGIATADTGPESQGGYALSTGGPVIVSDLRRESRFRGSPLLREHGVISGISVIIEGHDKRYGVMGAHTSHPRVFSRDDVSFLQSVANVIGSAIARMHTEAEIQKQRELLQVTLASIGDAIVTTDSSGIIEFVNPICERVTGWNYKDVVGKQFSTMFRMVNGADGQAVPDPVAGVMTSGQGIGLAGSRLLVGEDGRSIPIESSAAPIRDSRGELIGVVMTFRDVSGRVAAENAIRESEERYRAIAETAEDAIITIDEEDRIILANAATEAIFGYSVNELLGQSLATLIPEGLSTLDGAGRMSDTRKSQDQPPQRERELYGRHKSGRMIPLEISTGEYERDGKKYSTGIIRDVSDRRAVEDQLQFQANVLRNVRDGVIVSDERGKIVYWNDGATAVFGYTADEMIGTQLAQLLPRDTRAAEIGLSELAPHAGAENEVNTRRKNGKHVWINVKTTPLVDAKGGSIGYITVCTDITERKRAEERLVTQYDVTRALAESDTIADAAPKVLESICTSQDWEVGILWAYDRDTDVLRCLDVWRPEDMDIREFELLTREMLFVRGVGIPGRVWEAGCPEWADDIAIDQGAPRAKVAIKNDLHAAAGFPIMTGNEFIGVVEFYSRRMRQPERELVQMMDILGSQIGQFIKRKRAEQALRLSEEQYSVILRGVGEGITAQDPMGRLIYANEAAAQIIGYESPEQLLQTPVNRLMGQFEVLDEKGHALATTELPSRVALQEKRPVTGLLRFRVRRTGEERWSQLNSTPIFDEAGQVRFVINIFYDVTEQRKSEETVREQRELLHVTLASIGDAVVSTDTRGRVTFMNHVAEQLTGWPLDDAVGKPLEQVFKIVSEETGSAIPSPAERVLKDHEILDLPDHTVLISRDARKTPIDDSAAPIRDKEGNVIGIVLVFRDITAKREAERDVSRLAAIVNSNDDAIISKTLDGIILTWNPAAERLFGYRADEVIGKHITVIYPPDRLPEFERNIRSLRRGESIEHFDTVRKAKDGRLIDVSLSISLIHDQQGHVIGASKILRDITDRKRAEEETRLLAEASDVLASSLDYETTLASVAKLAVPRIADWCAIYVQGEDGHVQQLAVSHADPTKVGLAMDMQRRYPPKPEEGRGVYKVLKTGKPDMVSEFTPDMLAQTAQDVEHLRLLTEVGLTSYMAVPMIARGRTLGVIVFLLAESRRHYGLADLSLAEDLARRAALAMDNARLYRESQALNEELEQRVVRRTIELQNMNRQLEQEIANRERMNERLRSLSGYLQSAREEERIRIAREIHDEIGQVLTAVKMDLALLARELTADNSELTHEGIQEGINSTTTLVDNALQTMHNIIRELRPEVLDHLGLRAAVEWQIQEFQTRTKIHCRYESDLDDTDMDPERSTAIFRILQETLTNVARHANASQVDVELRCDEGSLVLDVRDDGQGILESSLTNSSRFGILGMRERARAFGGDIEIQGDPGKGTHVRAWIPLDQNGSTNPHA